MRHVSGNSNGVNSVGLTSQANQLKDTAGIGSHEGLVEGLSLKVHGHQLFSDQIGQLLKLRAQIVSSGAKILK